MTKMSLRAHFTGEACPPCNFERRATPTSEYLNNEGWDYFCLITSGLLHPTKVGFAITRRRLYGSLFNEN